MPKTKDITKTEKATKVEKVTAKQPSYYYAVGRRREATARVRLYVPGNEEMILNEKTYAKGQVIVNDRLVESYFPGEVSKKLYQAPFRTTNTLNRFVTTVRVTGGGLYGQLDAVIHGISRALVTIDKEKYRPILKKKSFLTRDPRAKQRRKAGYAGKARKKKQSPKR
jgi:small subunit ribosomal protein S9